MNTMKRASSLLLVLLMILSLAMPVGAEENVESNETFSLTVNNTIDGHTYQAYQIFSGTLTIKDDKQILSDIKWGTGVNGDALLTAIKADTSLSALHSATNAATLAEKVATLTSDSESLNHFAKIVGKHLAAASGTCSDKGDYYEISGLKAGYYLIKDQDDSLKDTAHDSYTQYIIRVLKDESVSPKSSVPTVEKSINDTLGGTFTEMEDFDINDTAYYKWVGTLSSNLKSYNRYLYRFVDKLPKGLVFIRFEQIYVEGHDGNVVHTFYDLDDASTDNDELPAGIAQNVESDAQTGGQTVTLTINDLLTLYPSILPTHKIVVKYTARVTRDAVVADAMTNSVKLEYSNNPYDESEGEPDTGTTPDDVAHAFTFQINVDKYDTDDSTKKLEGAEFVLYYERVENVEGKESTVKYYAKVVTEEDVYVMDKDGNVTDTLKPEADRILPGTNGIAVDGDDIGVAYGWTTDRTQASVLDTNAQGKLNVRGLDSGIYYLEETKAPAGYNLMETPVMIEIIPTYTENGKEVSATVSYKVDSIPQSSDTVGVRNSSGSTLPSTGGIGTTLFYVFGSVLVLAAVVMLVAKKRMSSEN